MKLKQAEKLQIIIKIEFGKCETIEQVRHVCSRVCDAVCVWWHMENAHFHGCEQFKIHQLPNAV